MYKYVCFIPLMFLFFFEMVSSQWVVEIVKLIAGQLNFFIFIFFHHHLLRENESVKIEVFAWWRFFHFFCVFWSGFFAWVFIVKICERKFVVFPGNLEYWGVSKFLYRWKFVWISAKKIQIYIKESVNFLERFSWEIFKNNIIKYSSIFYLLN